jgi:hypothetical protein
MRYFFSFLFIFLTTVPGYTQKNKPALIGRTIVVNKNLSDSALLDVVQKQTIKYFWDFAHPVSGLARERSNKSFEYGDEVVTTGGSGFGLMALIVGVERKWLGRDTVARHILKTLKFLSKADAYHGVQP